jgi:hypothetical protein
MPNPENIEKHKFRKDQCRDKAAINGRKGGIKSGESRRARKTLREALLGLLDEDDRQDKMLNGLVKRATTGDAAAAKLVAELIGEYKQSIDVGVADVGLIVEFEDEGED